MKRRTILAFICILLAVAIGFVLMPAYNMQQYKKTATVVALQDIPEGTKITAAMVQTTEAFAQSVPADTVTKTDDVVGKYASHFISKADYVTASKLTSAQLAEQGISVTGNKMIVSITIPSPAAGVSGALKPGDLVSVYAIPKQSGSITSIVSSVIPTTTPGPVASVQEPGISDNAILPDELKYVEVAGIYNGSAKTDDKTDTAAIPATVSFYVNAIQAKKLVEIDNDATLHLVLVARGDARLQFLNKEDLQLWF